MSYNGNDAIGLFKGDQIIDQVGFPDSDADIDAAGITGAGRDYTFVRKPHITRGNTNWAESAGTNEEDSEWIIHPINSFEFLGWHEFATSIRNVWGGDISVYPNPFGNQIRIDNVEYATRVEIYNLRGQRVLFQDVTGSYQISI